MTSRHEDTIAALATPAGESGIAVIRMSGPDAVSILTTIFRPQTPVPEWEHRRMYHGDIVDGEEAIDDVMCGVMLCPESYTGEDVVEVSCHGNSLLVKRILALMYTNGARAAEAGEFTKRSFLNGKMDLIQAEAVSDLIHAKSDLQRSVAKEQLAGGLSRRINIVAGEMLDLLGLIEANIDFIEDGIDTLDVDTAMSTLDRHRAALGDLLVAAPLSKPFHEGYRVAIVGPVNAGKSSLFNRLLEENRAIVTEVPGTTRDVLREAIVIEGLLFVLYDTAGLRDTDDQIEQIGIELAKTAASDADIVLYVVDATGAGERLGDAPSERKVVTVINKSDLVAATDSVLPGAGDDPVVVTSVKTGDGIDALKKTLVECVGRDRLDWIARERVVLNARLVATLENARRHLDALRAGLNERAPLEILALDARACLEQYEIATGKRFSDDLLDTIFSRFCIGK